METRHVFILILILSVFDFLAINSSFLVVSWFYPNPSFVSINYWFYLAINILWLLSALANKLYRYNSVQTFSKMCYKSIMSYCCQVVFIYILASNIPGPSIDRTFYFYFLALEVSCLVLIRLFIRVTEIKFRKLDAYRKIIAIVGYDEVSGKLAEFFKQNNRSYNFAGHFRDVNEPNRPSDLEILKRNIQFAIDYKLDEVYSTIFPEDCEGLAQVITMAERNCIRVKFITTAGAYESKLKNNASYENKLIGYFNGMPILLNRSEPLSLLRNRILKRAFDIIFSLGVIVFLLSWLYPVLAIIIRIDSPGPILFKQLRSGRNNKPFWCYKFRSMRINSNSNKVQATKNDARVTKIGAFMRRTSVDELPQFFNVLFGNMSIVGPRPHMLKHTFEYKGVVDQYMIRLFSKPGITGWAQVNGYRGETKDQEQMQSRIDHDIWYMENWLLLHDVKIVYKTFVNVIKGQETAY